MSGCAKDKIDQDREKCCIESIAGGDVHQQSIGKTCEDRGPGKVTCVSYGEASSPIVPGTAGGARAHISRRYLAGQPRAPC